MIKNGFYFTLKALFVLKIFKFLSWIFVHVEQLFDWKDKVNFKIYHVAAWEKNYCITHITRSLKKNQTVILVS